MSHTIDIDHIHAIKERLEHITYDSVTGLYHDAVVLLDEVERLQKKYNACLEAIERHRDKVQGNPNNSAYQGQADRELWAALDREDFGE